MPKVTKAQIEQRIAETRKLVVDMKATAEKEGGNVGTLFAKHLQTIIDQLDGKREYEESGDSTGQPT